MKTYRYFYAIIVFLSLVLLTSCTDKSTLLLKTWKIENLKYTTDIPAEMQPQIEKIIDDMRVSFRITYNADGTYKTLNGAESISGKWKLNWNSSSMYSTSDKGDSKTFKILELTSDKFVFRTDEGQEDIIYEMVPAND